MTTNCLPCQAARAARKGIKAAYQIAARQVEAASGEEQAARLAHCRVCPELRRFHDLPQGADVGLADRCGVCGCFVRAKTAYRGGEFVCPKGKWQ